MKYLVIATIFLLAAGCAQGAGKETGQGEISSASVKAGIPYAQFLDQVVKPGRLKLKDKNPEAASAYLYTLINNDIAAYWTGTAWDFNGTTRIPGKGTIACGYFVTNVLADLGFAIRRVALAQQVSSHMIKELTVDIERVNSIAALKAYLDVQKPNSVFITGLDFHTGFIIKTGKDCYFLHANYINRQGVVKELIDHCAALAASKSFMIGNLTANKQLLAQWVKGK